MSDPALSPVFPPAGPEGVASQEGAAAAAPPLAQAARRRYRPSRAGRQSQRALAARRANIAKARAVAREKLYRPTARRRAASLANLAKAHAWRRSRAGNEVARRNAFRHGLAAKKLAPLLVPLGEGPADLARYREMVRQVFLPQDAIEAGAVEHMAQMSWRRMRLLRARAREELLMWRRLQAQSSQKSSLSQEETERRVAVITRRLYQSSRMEDEAFALEMRIVKLLDALVAARGRGTAEDEESAPNGSED